MSLPPELIIEEYLSTLQEAYSLARAERLSELRGRYIKRFDSRGCHPYSVAIGRIEGYIAIYPPLGELDFNTTELRDAARYDAAILYEREIALKVGLRLGWITPEEAEAINKEE